MELKALVNIEDVYITRAKNYTVAYEKRGDEEKGRRGGGGG